MSDARVRLWGKPIAAISWNAKRQCAAFEYEPAFVKSGIELSPIVLPLSNEIYSFPALRKSVFAGMPGLLADSLPDRFGNALIDAWLVHTGRSAQDFNPVDRLLYIGTRGMGALEFSPSTAPFRSIDRRVKIDELVILASEILTHRKNAQWSFQSSVKKNALTDILRVGTSAGGARAKAVIAWNERTDEVRSGQIHAGDGFSYWIVKFDGVGGNKDKDLDMPLGYGLIEYAYYTMARAAGIEMSDSRIFPENGRHHFMTKRFDRTDTGKKIHMQSLSAVRHFDFNDAGVYSYEQAVETIRMLGLPMASVEEQFRRMAFNIVARNQDDHVKNIAFLMDKSGAWRLSPAFDMTYSYNPAGDWTSQHQMSMNGKRDHFTRADFIAFGDTVSMKKGRAAQILDEVIAIVRKWDRFAEEAGVPEKMCTQIQQTHRVDM